jgi:hypothetical protein
LCGPRAIAPPECSLASVDQRCLGSAHCVGPVCRWIQADFLNPGIQYARVLPCPQMRGVMNPTGKQVIVICQFRLLDPFSNGISRRRSDFKLNQL